MITLQKSVPPINFLMVKLMELEHLCRGAATLNSLGTLAIKEKQQFKKVIKVL